MRGRSIALGVSTRAPAHTSQSHTDCCPASQFNRVKLETIKASLGPRGSVRGRGNRYGDSEGGETGRVREAMRQGQVVVRSADVPVIACADSIVK